MLRIVQNLQKKKKKVSVGGQWPMVRDNYAGWRGPRKGHGVIF